MLIGTSVSGAIVYSGSQDLTLPHDSDRIFEIPFGGPPEDTFLIVDLRGTIVMLENGYSEGIYDFIPDASDPLDPTAAAFDFGMEIDGDFEWSEVTGASIRLANYWEENAEIRGEFFDQSNRYLPLRTVSDDSEFYGWLRMSHSMEDELFTVHDWAWNDTAGEPILAGQIPEPATYAKLFGIGVLGFVVMRRVFRGRKEAIR